jgi:hypothetical protein
MWHQLNAVLGSLTVTVGLWLLIGALPVFIGITLAIALTILLAWKSPSIGTTWAICTFLLGVESLAWPVMQMSDLQKLGPEPSLEELQRIFTAVLFGLFSGVFWMTFAYGIFKRTRGTNTSTTPPLTISQTKNQRKRSRKKSS